MLFHFSLCKKGRKKGACVSASLVHASAGRHVPYRDSKLTRMLQDSLGGNSYTASWAAAVGSKHGEAPVNGCLAMVREVVHAEVMMATHSAVHEYASRCDGS